MTDPLPRRLFATRAIFLILGIAMAAWAPLVPIVKARLDISEGTLGLLILCLGGGAFLAMPLAGALSARLGLRAVILWPALVALAAMPFLLLAPGVVATGAVLALVGAGLGTTDVAMNLQAVEVEKAGGVPRMSAFHGMWSVGGILGAGSFSGLLWMGLPPLWALLSVVVSAAVATLAIADGFIPRQPKDGDHPLFVRPRGRILFLGILCCLAFLCEFSVLDWSAVFLAGSTGATVAVAGLGYAAFSLAMTAMRFAGDGLRARFGEGSVMAAGGIVAAVGFGLVATATGAPQGLLGYFLVGLGIANIVPILFSVAGRSKDMPPHLALTAVAMIAHLGALGGPAIIGAVAEVTSLRVGFGLLALAALGIALSFRVARA